MNLEISTFFNRSNYLNNIHPNIYPNREPNIYNNILFVMIGNMPTDEESVNHWKNFIENSDNSLHIVIHPMNMNIRNDIINKWTEHFQNKNNFMVCDQDHWVKTKWGNVSLSLATLIAIEYAMKNKPYNYYKKIVFLQQCLPLYNFNIIKNEFIKDNKSWFKPRGGEYPIWAYSQPYNFNRTDNDGATIYDWNWWNAIFAIDQSHFNIFFDESHIDENNNYIGTYKKEGEYICYGENFDNIVSINKGKYDVLFKQVTGSWDWNNPSTTASCINSDEVFFGVAFKHHFKGNDIVNHTKQINTNALSQLYNKNILSIYNINNSTNTIHLFDENDKKIIKEFNKYFGKDNEYPILNIKKIDKLDENLYVYLPRIVWLDFELYMKNTDYPIYSGMPSNYNPEKLNEYYIKRREMKDGILKNTIMFKGEKQFMDYEDNWTNKGQQELIKKKNTNNNDENQFTLKNIVDQHVSYHDWTSFTISPENIFRDAVFTKYLNNKCTEDGKITTKINSDINELLDYIKTNNLRMLSNKLPIWHPVEYFTIKLNTLINSYNIASLCILCQDNILDKNIVIQNGGSYNTGQTTSQTYGQQYDDGSLHNYFNLIKIIKFTWRRAILLFSDYVDEDTTNNNSIFRFKNNLSFSDLELLKNVKIGTCITEDILSSALASGSLFIRKCVKGSEISKYTNALYRINSYIPNMIIPTNNYSNKKDFGEFLYLPKSIFTWEYFRTKKSILCQNIKEYDITSINTSIPLNFIRNKQIIINNIIFKYDNVLGKGTNEVVLYKSEDNMNVLIKQSFTKNSLENDIEGIRRLEGKSYKNKFIYSYKIDDDNILLEIFSGTLSSLNADYLYNSSLSNYEYIKIIYFIIDVIYKMSLDGLYYTDLKLNNILYKCNGDNKLEIKFGDVGSISTTPKTYMYSYPTIDNTKTEKELSWGTGICIIELIGSVYIDQNKYIKLYRKEDKTEFITFITDLKNEAIKNIKKYFDNSDEIINLINKLLVFDSDNRYLIYEMYNHMTKIYNTYNNTYNNDNNTYNNDNNLFKNKYMKYKLKYLKLLKDNKI
jgi:hypothetical protein